MDLKVLSFIIGIGGTIATVLGGGVIPLIIGILGFAGTTYGFLRPHKKPFKPEDPYKFHWRPVIILAIMILLVIFSIKTVV